jgi:hypothetical protein
MPKYVVGVSRAFRGKTRSSLEMLKDEPGVCIVGAHNPNIVAVTMAGDVAANLQIKLGEGYRVEAKIEHSLA